jgi:hypothetical protein
MFMKTIATILLLVGFLFTVFAGFQIASRELADIDPKEINNPDKFSLYWSPITALAFIVAGTTVLILSKKENKVAH